jgi:very-short-patch-repair endonuclease
MEVADAITWRGGVADLAFLRRVTSRRRLRTAVQNGTVVRVARGRYGLPDADEALREAARLHGVASHLSAAQLNGWELKHRPSRPCITVPRGRKVEPWRRRGTDLFWRDIEEDDVWYDRTSASRTVIDCARDYPFDVALTVADSALRHGNLTSGRLLQLAEESPRTGRPQCLRVAQHASRLAANPFESVMRAVSLEVPGLDLQPQVVIEEDGWLGRPDLVNVERRIVAEADSFEFHGRRQALKNDCERYNALTLRGWLVLRFSYEHVMFDPRYVLDCFRVADEWRPRRRTVRRRSAQKTA